MKLFRVYDKANHRWITDNVMIDSGGGAELVRYRNDDTYKSTVAVIDTYLPDEVEIEWNTGTYDSRGNEIYVGDIVISINGRDEIVYDDNYGGFCCVPEGCFPGTDEYFYSPLTRISRKSVVIGNIHGLEMEE